MYAIRKVLAGCLLACASLATAGAPQLLELDRHVPGIRLPGVGGFAIADFDRDGRACGALGFVHRDGPVYGAQAGGIAAKQAVFLTDARLARVLAIEVTGDPQCAGNAHAARPRQWKGRQTRCI